MMSNYRGVGCVGLLMFMGAVGCASQRQAGMMPLAPNAPVVQKADQKGDAGRSPELERFRRWLARENSWTQRQRLDHIQREWLPRLQALTPAERAQAAEAIADAIPSARLDLQRTRVIEHMLENEGAYAAR